MANTLASLKELPCPLGSSCKAFKCLFKHDHDEDPTASSLSENTNAHPESPDGPRRKRPKLVPEDPVSTPRTEASKPKISVDKSREENKSSPLRNTKIAISPPPQPLTNRSSTETRSSASSSVAERGKVPAVSMDTLKKPAISAEASPKPKRIVKREPPKAESLNPRLLKKSPAQHDMRLRLLKLLHEQYDRLNKELKKESNDEHQKLVLSPQELITKALDDEVDIAIKKPSIYTNVLKTRIMTYKRMSVADWKKQRTEETKKTGTEEQPGPTKPIEAITTGLTSPQEVRYLHNLAVDLDGLERYGYVTSIPSAEDINSARNGVAASDNNEVCDRCGSRFQVFPGRREEDGALTTRGSCTHHPGKIYYTERAPGDRSRAQKKYRCCHQNLDDVESTGCTTSSSHVFKITDPKRLASVLNFANTPDNPHIPADRAVCFDCEMGYTVYGLELIRLTVVSWPDGEELLDILVQPMGEILDLNTRYSGVRPEDMIKAERWKPGSNHSPKSTPNGNDASLPPIRQLKIASSPKDARELFFSLISPSTPVIGHGLENDLNALRVVHPTCIDTVLLYPHKKGLPMRNGLKRLMEDLLGRQIQTAAQEAEAGTLDDQRQSEGHDSAEDARAAGELVRLKIKNEWQRQRMEGWTFSLDGQLVNPSSKSAEDNGGAWTVMSGKSRKAR